MAKVPKSERQVLLKADRVTLVASAEKDGHIRLTCSAWDDAKVASPLQSVELRWVDGQVHLIRKDKGA